MGLRFCSPIYWQAVSWLDTFSLIEFPTLPQSTCCLFNMISYM